MAATAAAKRRHATKSQEHHAKAKVRVLVPRPVEFAVPDVGRVTVEFRHFAPAEALSTVEEHNPKNRKVKVGWWKPIARDILADKWSFTGQPIIFGRSGNLLDGQHRLKAIGESGKGQWLVVVRGVPESALHAIDANNSRSNAVRLTLVDRPQPSKLISVANQIHKWDGNAIRMTDSELWARCEALKPIAEPILARLSSDMVRTPTYPAAILTRAVLHGGYKQDAVERVADVIGADMFPSDPTEAERATGQRLREMFRGTTEPKILKADRLKISALIEAVLTNVVKVRLPRVVTLDPFAPEAEGEEG